ncbi:response regulator [Asticcacaulis solisilvae]|uniref:response regulator n=1 Tax=Asticcacaulis solisilvae TaxID=1217274 RepID=UPI003FD770C2
MTAGLHHVLCIDDDSDILEIAQMALEDVGQLQVTCMSNGEAAVESAAGLSPDFILIDVMMPGMDGPGVLKALRAQPGLAAVPVAFMTARIQEQEVRDYLDMGADGVISKPFDPMTLPSEIRTIWETFHAGRH